ATGLRSLAWDLPVKLPRTSAALRDGVLDQDKTQVIASWCAPLTDEQARQAEDMLFDDNPDLATMTWTMVRDRIARAVMTVDPDAARKRRDRGAKDARVETRLELSGDMQVAARELPPASALALDQKLTARARELKKAGIPGTLGRLRVLAYLERWGITDPFGHPDPDSADPDTADHDGADRNGADADRDRDQDQADADWPEDWPRTDGPDDSGPDDGPDDDGPDDDGHGPGRPGGAGGGSRGGRRVQ